MREALTDQVELNSLIGTQNYKSILDQSQARWKAETDKIAAGLNGMATASPTTSAAIADPSSASEDTGAGGIVNRSPTTNYHYYQAPPPTAAPAPVVTPPTPPAPTSKFSPWWLVLPLLVGLGGLAWYFWPATTGKPPNWTGDTTIIWK